MDFEQEIKRLIRKEVKDDILLERPNSEFGDYAFPCFELAKKLKKSPYEIAKDLANKIKLNKYIEKIEVKGAYLNFFVNKDLLVNETIERVLKEKDEYGSSKTGKNKNALVEHTSINPNASPHVGRARNALIGDSIVRILRFQKYNVKSHYFVNDVGKQIAILVYGSKNKKVSFDKLLGIYAETNKRIEKNKEIEKEIFSLLNRLEKGDAKIVKLFRDVVSICIKGQKEIFNKLGIKYDYFDYESDYLWDKKINKVLEDLRKTGKLFLDENKRTVLSQEEFDLAMKSKVLVLTRADGTSLYPLRDIAYTIDKLNKAEKNVLVLGEDHKLYSQQIKAALQLLGYKAPEVVHYSFILLSTGDKMSTRKGDVVLLEDLMNEVEKRANIEIKNRYKKTNKDLARKIGYAALKFGVLKIANERNILFDLEEALSFEGDTGPYVQYSYARASSILRKAKIKAKVHLLKEKEELELVSKVAEFPSIVEKASKELKPNLIANYVYELASKFNEFYHKYPVLKAEKKITESRLALVIVVRQVIKNSLSLLGIDAVERM